MPAYSSRYTQSEASSPPPPPDRGRRASARQRRPRPRGYSAPREKPRRDVTIIMCVYKQRSHNWHSVPMSFDPYRTTDEELWLQIRDIYRTDLQPAYKRLFGFKKLKYIVPIEFSRNSVPLRQDPKNVPNAHEFKHCYHHPERIVTKHEWVEWWVEFEKNPDRTYGLEFIEGLWAEKLGLLAVLVNIATIIVSAVWCAYGGDLQTVFTVMSFVITAAAADIALLALYFQIQSPT